MYLHRRGVLEAGCKVVIGTRLKRAGMRWTVHGANAIIALRCSKLSGRFEDFWERRREPACSVISSLKSERTPLFNLVAKARRRHSFPLDGPRQRGRTSI